MKQFELQYYRIIRGYKKIEGFDKICEICYNEKIRNITCSKCCIELFKKGNGIICQYCRHSIGEKIYDDEAGLI